MADFYIREIHPDDFVVWPDGECCRHCSLGFATDHLGRSQDFRIVRREDPEHAEILWKVLKASAQRSEEILLWKEGCWCYRRQLAEHPWDGFGDDYEVIDQENPRYGEIEGNCQSCQAGNCTAGTRCVAMGQD